MTTENPLAAFDFLATPGTLSRLPEDVRSPGGGVTRPAQDETAVDSSYVGPHAEHFNPLSAVADFVAGIVSGAKSAVMSVGDFLASAGGYVKWALIALLLLVLWIFGRKALALVF